MKDKSLRLKVMQYAFPGKRHWYVFPNGLPYPQGISQRFGKYEDAYAYAKKHAYVKNIKVVD